MRKKLPLSIVLALPIFILAIWRLYEVQQPIIYSDEYGYWSNSAFFMGNDWSSVTSRIGYYSYGYSFILVIVRLIANLFGFTWYEIYQTAVVINAFMLVGSYFLAFKLCRRYFPDLDYIISNILCMVVFLYSSNIFYAHLTLTETTILFCFWIFLYLLMKVSDAPNILNHIFLGLISVYMFAVHQRTVAILVTSIVIVIVLKLFNINKLKDVAVFMLSVFIGIQLHSTIKFKLQNDSYLGLQKVSWQEAFGKNISLKSLALLLLILSVIAALYLIQKGKARWVVAAILAIAFIGIAFIIKSGMLTGLTQTDDDFRIATNDFSGQWVKILNIFTVEGILRLLISITGKWFYMASATGLVVCWGIKDLVIYAVKALIEAVKAIYCVLAGKEVNFKLVFTDKCREDIWKLGVFLAAAGTFMICAIYKEGLYKNDDLLNGRYNEFLMGILLILGFYSLVKDKHWIRNTVIFLSIYLAAGVFCQYTLNEVQRTEFELCHSVMLGRIIWNYEVPYGKLKILMSYVIPLGLAFIAMVKVSGWIKQKKMVCYIVTFMIPVVTWTYLTGAILDNYVISLNNKHQNSTPNAAFWIEMFDSSDDYPIYYLEDTKNIRFAQALQYMLEDRPVTLAKANDDVMNEDAFFVTSREYAHEEHVQAGYEIIAETDSVAVLVNRNYELMEKWQKYKGID